MCISIVYSRNDTMMSNGIAMSSYNKMAHAVIGLPIEFTRKILSSTPLIFVNICDEHKDPHSMVGLHDM